MLETNFKSTCLSTNGIQCRLFSGQRMMSPMIALLAGLFFSVLCPVVSPVPRHHHPRIDVKDEAIIRLSQVFGMPSVSGVQTVSRDPPQYMLNLYNSVADENGVTRSSNPYNATIIRSFVNKGAVSSDVLLFNVSGVQSNEAILKAELRLYRHQQKGRSSTKNCIYMVQIYQMSSHSSRTNEKNRLLVTKYVDAADSAWETFNIYAAVIDWISGESPNCGLLVVTTSLQGDESHLFRDGSSASKLPILVLFSTNQMESPSAKPSLEEYDYNNNFVERKKRSLRTAAGRTGSRATAAAQKACSLADMYVNFDEIGWSSWIISPKGYNAHACRGRCSFPLGQNQKPTNHATVQSIVSELDLVDVGQPCCVPNRLLSLSLLYYDDHDNVILKQYEDMVADGCGCL